MRIVLLYRSLDQGGVQRMMVSLANYLVAHDIDVTILLLRKEGEFIKIVDNKVNIESFKTDTYLSLLPQLVKKLKQGKYDLLFTATPSLNVVAIIASLIVKVKVVISERSDPLKEFIGTRFGFYKLAYAFIPLLYRYADEIVCVSQGVANSLVKMAMISKSRIQVIYNPAYNPNSKLQVDEQVEHPWLLNKTIPVIISAGRLAKQKNFTLLINAFCILQQRRPLRLIILGEGPDESELKKLVEKLGITSSVDFVGFKINPIAWISKADVFVLSSLWEGFGNILIDALASRTTIVSTDCKSGPSEILDGGTYGYLLSDFTPLNMATYIEKALDAPFNKELLLSRASMFSTNIIMRDYEKVFGLSFESPRNR